MLAARSQTEASRLRRAVDGKGCTVQLAAILPKIREVDALMSAEMQRIVREGHPEVTFAVMNNDHPMAQPKRRKAGRDERLALLVHHFPDAPIRLAELRHFREDAIDAYAMLWTAYRVARGVNRTLPESPATDLRGNRMEMVA
jgi:predicted RNase H-like nuclease